MRKLRCAWVLCSLLLAACGDDDGGSSNNINNLNNNNQDPCVGVTCSGHGTCVATGAQAACDCEAGYHADGLACVVDANTPPVITSTPASDATAQVEYAYPVTCTDAEGDALTISIGVGDTCDATLTDNGDGTALYHFTAETGGLSCALHLVCSDGEDEDTQIVAVAIASGGCVEDTTFTGQVYIPDPPDPTSECGGVFTTDPYPVDYDAGVGTLNALLPATLDATAAVDVSLVEATVAAVGEIIPPFVSIWLADGTGQARTWLPQNDETQLPSFHVRVGQRVSVRVTELLNYRQACEITKVEPGSWALVSEDNEVSVPDRTGGPVLTAADNDLVVRLTGSIAGDVTTCGTGMYCYPFEYGASAPAVLRLQNADLTQGTCVTWVGPSAMYATDVQLTVYDPSWVLLH